MTRPPTMQDMGWLLNNFANSVAGIAHVVAVSADGLLLASSRELPADRADQLAAITVRRGQPHRGRVPDVQRRRRATDDHRDGQRLSVPDVHQRRFVDGRARRPQLRRRPGRLRDGAARRAGRRGAVAGTREAVGTGTTRPPRGRRSEGGDRAHGTADSDPRGKLVRPYAVTRGRTEPRQDIPIEAVLVASQAAVQEARFAGHDKYRIAVLCEPTPQSLAELSALPGCRWV